MYGILDISTSGMVAQRTRLNAVASNIANRNAVLDANGNVNPYRARRVHFAPGDPSARSGEGAALGVHVAKIEMDNSEPMLRWDPGNPLAYKTGEKQGYVPEPNVNPIVEQINAMDATRAYEANVVAAEATKSMMSQVLRLLA